MGGMLSALKFAHTKNARPDQPSKYVNFDLEDMEGSIRSILWPRGFADMGELVQPEAILIVHGTIDRRGGGDEANLIVNKLVPLDQLDALYTTGIMIRVDQEKHGTDALPQIREIVRGYPGQRELQLVLALEDGSQVHIRSHALQVDVAKELRSRIDDLLGPGNLRLITAPPKPSQGNGRARNGRARAAS